MEVNTVEELHGLLRQAKHSNWREEMRDNQTVRICPHCGQGKQYRHGTGRFLMWTPCGYCSNIRKHGKIKV